MDRTACPSPVPVWRCLLLLAVLSAAACGPIAARRDVGLANELPSWNDTPARAAITGFVAAVTDPDGPYFVPEPERIAVFDNDGTLWSEQPLYFQFDFVAARLREMAADHPEWRHEQPFQAVLEGDMEALAASGEAGLAQLLMATHAEMTQAEFASEVAAWLSTARHERFNRLYTELVYQPMLELLGYLRDNGFKTFIVSGGGIDFLRGFAEDAYGIPPEQVVGSSILTRLETRDGEPVIVRHPKIDFINDGEGKPLGIDRHIGRRPIAAFGNSDGDLEMLQWTAAGPGQRLMVIVHHTDAAREWVYDRESRVGRLDQALDQAGRDGWTVIDMAADWKVIYPFELEP